MTVLQALIFGICGWICGESPFGNFAIVANKPLVIAFIAGLVFGDMPTAMAVGIPLQALYLGSITIGGVTSMPSIKICGWFIIPIAILAKSPEAGVVMAASFGTLENITRQFKKQVNVLNIHYGDRLVREGNLKGATLAYYSCYLWSILFCGVIPFLCCLLGADFIINAFNLVPNWFMDILKAFVSLCPLIGFSLLMNSLVNKKIYLLFVAFGFMLAKIAGLDIISITILASAVSALFYMAQSKKEEAL